MSSGSVESSRTERMLDLIVVGAGPTGIAVGAAAKQAGYSVLLVDRGPLVASLVDYPNDMVFFTNRERLEIAGIPFAVPEDKPSRRQAIVYYQAVARAWNLDIASHEEIVEVVPGVEGFTVRGRGRTGPTVRRAHSVVIATGYFGHPDRLGVPGEDQEWVRGRFRDPLPHWNEDVAVIGAGNSGAEAALELFRHGARVTLIHRGSAPKATVKYWVKPDLENRIAEGSIASRFEASVVAFGDRVVQIESGGLRESLPVEAAYVLIGYSPDTGLFERAGVPVNAENGVPEFDPETCETPVPGLYAAGTVQAGRETHRIFIENSREHAPRIVEQMRKRTLEGAQSRRGTSLAPSEEFR